jgi:DNA-directed RNA polymerase subunit omega
MDKVDSRYTLVTLAAKRARDLIDGKPELTYAGNTEVPVSIASLEISQDFITYKRGENAVEPEIKTDGER